MYVRCTVLASRKTPLLHSLLCTGFARRVVAHGYERKLVTHGQRGERRSRTKASDLTEREQPKGARSNPTASPAPIRAAIGKLRGRRRCGADHTVARQAGNKTEIFSGAEPSTSTIGFGMGSCGVSGSEGLWRVANGLHRGESSFWSWTFPGLPREGWWLEGRESAGWERGFDFLMLLVLFFWLGCWYIDRREGSVGV